MFATYIHVPYHPERTTFSSFFTTLLYQRFGLHHSHNSLLLIQLFYPYANLFGIGLPINTRQQQDIHFLQSDIQHYFQILNNQIFISQLHIIHMYVQSTVVCTNLRLRHYRYIGVLVLNYGLHVSIIAFALKGWYIFYAFTICLCSCLIN